MIHKNPARFFSRGVFYCLLFAPTLGWSNSLFEPFTTRDQNPLVLIYGLPYATGAELPQTDRARLYTVFNISNTLNVEDTATTNLLVDTETSQFNLIYEQSITSVWAWKIILPFISHSPGYFDNAIDNYHQLMNFPQGFRPLYPQDQLHIHIEENGNTLIDIQQREHGLGDINLQLGRQLQLSNESATSIWTSIKLPTGDSDSLTGSGSTDLALWLSTLAKPSVELQYFGQAGVLYMSDSEVLSQWHNNFALFGNAGFAWRGWEIASLKAQLDLHTALYNSDLKFLGDVMQLTFGGSILFSPQSVLDIAMSEDIQNKASPDVTLNITWSTEF